MTQVGLSALDQLGANYGTLTDAKRSLWHRRLEHFEDADIVAACDRMLRDPRRERLPTIGQLLDLLPGTALPDHGVDMTRAFAWLDDGQRMYMLGNASQVPEGERLPIVQDAKRNGHHWASLADVLGVDRAEVV